MVLWKVWAIGKRTAQIWTSLHAICIVLIDDGQHQDQQDDQQDRICNIDFSTNESLARPSATWGFSNIIDQSWPASIVTECVVYGTDSDGVRLACARLTRGQWTAGFDLHPASWRASRHWHWNSLERPKGSRRGKLWACWSASVRPADIITYKPSINSIEYMIHRTGFPSWRAKIVMFQMMWEKNTLMALRRREPKSRNKCRHCF